MNITNYPNKAASWLNGKQLGDLTVVQVYRDNNARSPNYVAVVRNTSTGATRACSYAAIGRAFNRQDRHAAVHAFGQGSALLAGNLSTPTPVQKAAFSGLNASSVNSAVSVKDEDAAMAMMTALVRSARTNPRVANIVKTLATLVN